MAVQDDVAAIEFSQETELAPADIRAAGRRAADAARRMMTSTITEVAATETTLTYLAKGPGGVVKQMTMVLQWEELAAGRRRVRFSVPEYLTVQPKVLVFIPAGPKQAPALGSARRFAQALRAELAA